MAERCAYCHRKPRGKVAQRNAERYSPYCSYQCQQLMGLWLVREYLAQLDREEPRHD